MASVKKFDLDGTIIDVEDEVARAEANSASASVQTLNERVDAIEALSRLSVAYTSSTSTITFTNNTHK